MHQNPLYERILGLSTPWFVSHVDLDEDSGLVEVQVECEASASLCCPRCGQPSPRYDKRRRQWRHLDTCQFQTQVVANVPRVRCP
ncbi:transposase family protein, partial [Halomonas caseinilytica]